MSAAELISVGAVVGLNNFAVALMLGALGQHSRRWRIAGVFGAFEFTVPLIGLLIGSVAAGFLAGGGRLVGAILLLLLGFLAVRSPARSEQDRQRIAAQVTTSWGLFALAAGLTLDNLVVGFALGLGDTEPLLLATTIALFAVAFTLIGLDLGRRGRRRDEAAAQTVSGLLLIALGIAVALGWPG
jgi:putative Mn2+ efflux pump MntP